MFKWVFSFGALVLAVGLHATTYAATLTATDLLSAFNAIILSDASTSSDIEGASIIGGNFFGATVYNQPKGVTIPDTFNALNVYGSTVSGNTINVNNSGDVHITGSTGATINFNGGQYVALEPILSIAEVSSMMNGLSTYLSQLSSNSVLPTPDNNEVISATPDSNNVAVFNITVDDLSKIPSYSIKSNGATTIIFNVAGTTLDFKANFQGDDSIFDNIIWNFYEATSLEFETLFGGTVLAPLASVTNRNQIDGTLVAETWSGDGELHEYGFTGTIPVAASAPVPTPEPATMVLFFSGVVLLALYQRLGRRVRNGRDR